jgi:hypothetical protein
MAVLVLLVPSLIVRGRNVRQRTRHRAPRQWAVGPAPPATQPPVLLALGAFRLGSVRGRRRSASHQRPTAAATTTAPALRSPAPSRCSPPVEIARPSPARSPTRPTRTRWRRACTAAPGSFPAARRLPLPHTPDTGTAAQGSSSTQEPDPAQPVPQGHDPERRVQRSGALCRAPGSQPRNRGSSPGAPPSTTGAPLPRT